MMTDNVFDLQAWRGKLQQSGKGVKKNMTNLMLYLKNVKDLGNTIKWNELACRAEWNGHQLDEGHLIDIRLILENNQFEPTVSDLYPAVMRHAKENAFHPIRDYLRSLKWDGVPRLDHWLQNCLGAEDTPFVKAVGRRTLIAAVARAFKPGCKVDTVLVLEGPQGLKKSTAIARLFGQDYTAESVNLFDQHNKMVMSMMGAWCVELAEFIAIQKRDQNTVKGMLSMRSDRVVLPYAKMASDHPRQCIFFGTINPGDSGYLTDSTGNRRYWPVTVTQCNLEAIEAARDQIWAEAYRAFQADERWWLEGAEEEELASTEVSAREESDVWEDILFDKLNGYSAVTTDEALTKVGVPYERMGKREADRVAKCLRNLGFVLRFPKIRVAGKWKTIRKWEREV